MRRPALQAAILLMACSAGAEPDRLFLREGGAKSGKILQATDASYILAGRAGTENIEKNQVRFAVYGDPEQADEMLGLAGIRAHCGDPAETGIQVLTTTDFSREVLEAVRNAKRSIYLTTYYLSAGDSPESQELFQLLIQKAKEKKTVVIIAPAGSRAHASAKISSINFGQKLEDQGVTVRYLQKFKVQHKKLVIVDNRMVLIGSSNLTGAGMSGNQEINVKVTAPAFVKEARKDFDSLRRSSKGWRALKL